MRFYDPARGVKTEAVALLVRARTAVALEDQARLFGRQARARVDHRYARKRATMVETDSDRAIAVLQRIADEVRHDALDADLVGHHVEDVSNVERHART